MQSNSILAIRPGNQEREGQRQEKAGGVHRSNCQYCKKLEKEMVNLTDATVYIFVFPILPGSEEKAKAIWCSSDRLKTWEDHMLYGVEPKSANTCDTTALTKISKHAEKLRISVTPTLIFEDGVIKPGTLKLDQLEEHLTASR